MAALNYPDKPWSDGDTFTDNDVEYTYVDDGVNPGYWQGVAGGSKGYILPIASSTTLGGIKVGDNLTIESDGKLNAVDDGSANTLQEVTDAGNTTNNDIITGGQPAAGANDGASIGGNGTLRASRATSINIFEGYLTGSNEIKSRITADGDAQFGAGNISLNADGSASFAGTIDGVTPQLDPHLTTKAYVDAAIAAGGGGGGGATSDLQGVTDLGNFTTNSIEIGGTASTPNIKLNYGGSAEFAGTIQSGDYTDAAGGVAINYAGNVTIRNDNSSATPFRLFGGGTDFGDLKVAFEQDGSSTFANSLFITPPGNTLAEVELATSLGGGGSIYCRDNNEDTTIELDGSVGSAHFADRVDARGGVTVDGGSSLSTGIYYRDDSESYGLALYSNGSSEVNRKVFIKTDGSSDFAGRMDVGGNTLTDVALKVESNQTSNASTLYVQQHGAAGKALFIGVDSTNAHKVVINNDGSASYAGSVQSGPNDPMNTYKEGAIMAGGSGFVACYSNDASPLWRGYKEDNNSETSRINVDGSASFAGVINSGEAEAGKWRTDAQWGFSTAFENNGNAFIGLWNNTHTTSDAPYLLRGNVNGVDTVAIRSDGSARFDDYIRSGGSGSYSQLTTNDGLYIVNGNITTTHIDANGGAVFNGVVECGGAGTTYGIVGKNSAAGGNTFQAGGLFQNYTQGGSAIAVIPYNYVSGGPATASIKEDGSANFAGTVTVNNLDIDALTSLP